MKLIIAEKPSVARSIANVLGAKNDQKDYIEGTDCIVTWCLGHIAALSVPEKYDKKYGKWCFENLPVIPDKWLFEIIESKSSQYNVINKLVNDSRIDEIICAADAGREGECIFRYVYSQTGCTKPVKRLWISSMEDKAILDGMAALKPDSDYDNLYNAGLCRNKADWLVGMNATPLFSCRYGTLLSVGRVQTPTLAMICKRDYEVNNFIKQKYFTVELDCGSFTVSSERIDDEKTADSIAEECNGKNAVADSIKKEIKTVNPPKLYDLTTLQREANRQFGYTAQQTLDYIQSLYEKKIVTYPRTDSQYLTSDMKQTALDIVKLLYETFPDFKTDKEYEINISRCINDKKVSDHHAIIPTKELKNTKLDNLPVSERNILSLIAMKLILAVAEPHRYEVVKVIVSCANHTFKSTGKTVVEDGFKYIENHIKSKLKGDNTSDETAENPLPEIKENEIFENVSSDISEHFTSPPKSYTEDTLLSAMETAGNNEYENSDTEKKGLGTPATRAGIIETLVKRGFIKRDGKKIIADDKGINLINILPDEIKSAKLTADWETKLQAIEKGKMSADEFMNGITGFVNELVSKYNSKAEISNFKSDKQVIGQCPRCQKNIYESKLSYCCESGKDGCGFTLWKNSKFPQATISVKQASELLNKGKTILKAVSKDGKEYKAEFEIEDTGKYVNLKMIDFVRKAAGKCPRCQKTVYEGKLNYYCGSADGCEFVLWKQNKFNGIDNIPLKNAKELLSKGSTILNYKTKDGKQEFGSFKLEDTGKYINLKLEE